jgi:hypothetical protein
MVSSVQRMVVLSGLDKSDLELQSFEDWTE